MRAVLKNGAALSLHAHAPAPRPEDPHLTALTEELALTKAALAIAREQVAAAERRGKADAETARAAGVEQGRAEAQDRADEHLAALEQAATAAAQGWIERLNALEPLAATLARSALAKLFADTPAERFVAATVARHLVALRQAGATTIHVHPSLLPDLPDTGLAIVADPSLSKDGCRVALTLGSADLSVERQWRAVDALLASLEAAR